MYDTSGKPAWNLEESREKGLYAAAVAIAWGSQVRKAAEAGGTVRVLQWVV